MNIPSTVTMHPDVRAADTGHTIVLLNSTLNRSEKLLLQARTYLIHLTANAGNVRAAAEAAGIQLQLAEQITAILIERGILMPTQTPQPWRPLILIPPRLSWGVQESSVQLGPMPEVSWKWKLLAVPALLITLAARQIGRSDRKFARMISLVKLSARRMSQEDRFAAQNAVRAVRWVGRYVPARAACLEESVATMLILGTLRRHATWVHGMTSDPVQMHAWVEADGHQIEEPPSVKEYVPLTRIPETQ